MGWVIHIGEAPIMPKHCWWFFSLDFAFFRSICCVLQVQAYGDPAQYLECFNLAVLVIHNLAVQVEWKTDRGWMLVLADRTVQHEQRNCQTSTSCLEFLSLNSRILVFKNPRSDFWHHNFQAENLELLHSEPRILRVLLEVGPLPRNVDEGKDERS